MKCLRAYELSWHDPVVLDLGEGAEVVCCINDGGTPVLLARTDEEAKPMPREFWIGMTSGHYHEIVAYVPRIFEGAGMGTAILTYAVHKEVL